MDLVDVGYCMDVMNLLYDLGQMLMVVYMKYQIDDVEFGVLFFNIDVFDVVVCNCYCVGYFGDYFVLMFQFDLKFYGEFVGDVFGLFQVGQVGMVFIVFRQM